MGAETVIAIILGAVTVGGAIVGVALYAGKSRDVAETALHRTRNIEAAQQGFAAHVDATFARRDTVAIELGHIRESQARMEQQLGQLVAKL